MRIVLVIVIVLPQYAFFWDIVLTDLMLISEYGYTYVIIFKLHIDRSKHNQSKTDLHTGQGINARLFNYRMFLTH